MSEFLRKYWFVCLLAIGFVSVLIYYVMDLNKDNVSAKSADGSDVVASLSIGNVTSEEIFNDYQSFNSSLLYNMYRNAVADQAVETTEEMKTQADTYVKNMKSAIKSDTTGAYQVYYDQQLASLGFEGTDDFYDYYITMLKMRELDWDYIDEHFDELKDEVTTSPRTISIITMEVENADILTEEKEEKKNNIDQALENGDDFASVATAFSEDADTAANGGFYGYVDSSNTDLDSSILTAAAALEKGQTSDWITVTDSSSGTINMYKIYINETDMRTIFDSDDSDVVVGLLSAFLNADSTIEYKAVAAAAKNLDITFEDESVKEKLDEYLSQYIGTDSADADSETEESKETESEKESTDSADADTTGGEEDETK